MWTRDQAAQFIRTLRAAERARDDGKLEIDVAALRELVLENRELTAHVVRALFTPENRHNARRALLLAHLFREIFDEDLLVRFVRMRAADLAIDADALERGIVLRDERPAIIELEVEPAWIAARDVYAFQRELLFDGTEERRESLRAMRNRCVLGFPLEDDPRDVWDVPEARLYVAELVRVIPHFAYFLNGEPEYGAFAMYVATLAPDDTRKGAGIDLDDPAVAVLLAESVRAVMLFERELGDEPGVAIRSFMQTCDSEYVDALMDAVLG